jgi:hypothetical protein
MTYYPHNMLRAGDLHVISSTTYEDYISHLIGDLENGTVSVVRFDDVPGQQALHPYISTDIQQAMLSTSQLLKHTKQEDFKLLATLCGLLSDIYIHTGNTRAVGAYDDVILELQMSNLTRIASQLPQKCTFREELQSLITLLSMDIDHYGYLLNVCAHEIIRLFGQAGSANANTVIQSEMFISNINILVVPCGEKSIKKQQIFPTISYWQNFLSSQLGDDFALWSDDETLSLWPEEQQKNINIIQKMEASA